jgi:hypothetical protein
VFTYVGTLDDFASELADHRGPMSNKTSVDNDYRHIADWRHVPCVPPSVMSSPLLKVILTTGALLSASSAHAVIYGGINFPDGAISFADSLVSYTPLFSGGPGPTDPNYMDGTKALGIPNYSGSTGSVSLGAGGRIVLEFTDNYLTGSNSAAKDLHIFEIGPDIEDTDVDISKDGISWFSVGKVTGSTSSVDIDFYGYTSSDLFRFVRLTDVKALDAQTGSTVGADIDAVGAITTIARPPTGVPDSGSTLVLAAIALVGVLGLRRRLLT